MRRRGFERETGPATLGSTAKAYLLLAVRCTACRHRANIDPGEQAERYSADLPVPEWAARLRCSQCGSRRVDFVVTPQSTGGLDDR
jgi:DNA-directed RNA polymerase subunit RPC12/RpoP